MADQNKVTVLEAVVAVASVVVVVSVVEAVVGNLDSETGRSKKSCRQVFGCPLPVEKPLAGWTSWGSRSEASG